MQNERKPLDDSISDAREELDIHQLLELPNYVDRFAATMAHRECYVALIDSVLPTHGDKKEFAARLQISPQYFGNLRSPLVAPAAYGRTPGPQLARRIAENLPLERELRTRLREHIDYVWYWGQGKGIPPKPEDALEPALFAPGHLLSGPPLFKHVIDELMRDFGRVYQTAVHTSDPQLARYCYMIMQRICHLMLSRVEPSQHPFEYVEACLFLHDTLCVLNQAHDGLYYARLAREVLEELEPGAFRTRDGVYHVDRELLDYLRVNSVVAQVLAYRNMRLQHKAYKASKEAEWVMTKETKSSRGLFWARDIYEHRLKALSYVPDFTQKKVSELADKAREEEVRRSGKLGLHAALRISHAEARGYLQYGTQPSIDKALTILRPWIERAEQVEGLGPVHKSHLFKTYATIHWHRHDLLEWEQYIRLSLQIALAAGLHHQLDQARAYFGEAITPIANELKQVR